IGHNERLIARALASWSGDRSSITVATKGGMTRPEGRWELDGRARHLREACERSREALGVERIAIYQLHAPDPRTSFATSVRALASLQRDGLIDRIGLCNVTVGQIEDARRIADITTIQVELSVWNDAALLSGVAAYCAQHGLRLLAHRPLGGRKSAARTAKHPALQGVAAGHGVSPFDVALAWLTDLSETIVPLPGATRVETAQASAGAQRILLTRTDRERLDEAFPSGKLMRTDRPGPAQARTDAAIVMVMGIPAAGKTTLAQRFVEAGYQRLSRDETGGTLRALAGDLDRALDSGKSRIVVDNTYASRKSRAEVLQAAAAHRVPVKCIWVTTSLEDAQVNAAWRLIQRYGRLPGDDELASLNKTDVAAFLPAAQFRYQRELEAPDSAEGFASIEKVAFARQWPADYTNRAAIVWCDDIDERLVETMRTHHDEGRLVLGMSWQPGIAGGTRTPAEVAAEFEQLNARLGFPIDVVYCPHAPGPPRCWCRKPLPGLGVVLIHRFRLDPGRCIYIGNSAVDPGFARKLGFEYRARDPRN
ncbi:MAG TPA: aldo/keto reductase, partial [Vicinamibacterales bacterium]